jgi:DNA-binding response OmpR family regulator
MNRILIVDDCEQLAHAIQLALRHEGYTVECAHNAGEATALLERFRPELVLLDVVMPGPDGYSVLGHIRSRPELAGAVVIMLTGLAEAPDVMMGWRLGVDWYLTKPFQMQELLSLVRRFAEISGADGAVPNLAAAPALGSLACVVSGSGCAAA